MVIAHRSVYQYQSWNNYTTSVELQFTPKNFLIM